MRFFPIAYLAILIFCTLLAHPHVVDRKGCGD